VLAKSDLTALWSWCRWSRCKIFARALTELNDQGFMTVGLDSQGSETLGAVTLRQPLALVLGAEGKGLRQLTR